MEIQRAKLWCAETARVEAGVTVDVVKADTSAIVRGRKAVALSEITWGAENAVGP